MRNRFYIYIILRMRNASFYNIIQLKEKIKL